MGTLYEVPKDEDWGAFHYFLQKDSSVNLEGFTLKIERLTGENNDHWTVTI